MQNIKFVVKVKRGGTRAPEYVQRVDPAPIHMTTNRKLGPPDGKIHGGRRDQVPAKLPVHPGVGIGAGEYVVFRAAKGSRTREGTARQSRYGYVG
jgi:hypothetical protein